ncbi:MAG: phosphoheptose isomerase, partial [Bacteroidota bacterium]
MENTHQIKQHFLEAQEILTQFLHDDQQMENISAAAIHMIAALKNGGKILSCGNGGSHCDAMHFAEELTGRYRNNRPGIAAIAISDPSHISCVGNDYGYDFIFSRYVEALGKPGDVLLGISTSGNSKNIVNAMESAKLIGMTTIGLTGKDGGVIKDLCDIEIRAPFSNFADRAQEIHIKVIHSLIDSIEIGLGYR